MHLAYFKLSAPTATRLTVKAWTRPGPWRCEGKHFHYRFVDPWAERKMEPELLASACGLLECPRIDDNDRLYFSDMVLGGIHRHSPNAKIETVIPVRKHIGGMAFNEGGGLVLCGERGVFAWDERTGRIRDIVTHWEGKLLQ